MNDTQGCIGWQIVYCYEWHYDDSVNNIMNDISNNTVNDIMNNIVNDIQQLCISQMLLENMCLRMMQYLYCVQSFLI